MRLPVLAALAALSLTAPAQAAPVPDAAGDFRAWQAADETLLTEAWLAPGLHFDRVVLTAVPGAGHGGFEPRPNATYAIGEDVLIHAEPKGYGDLGDGKPEIGFDVDLRLPDPAGTILLQAPGFAALTNQAHGMAREFVGRLTVNLGPEAPAGDYQLKFTFNDREGGQSAAFTTDVTFQ